MWNIFLKKSTNLYSEEELRKLTTEELDTLYMEVVHVVMPAHRQSSEKRIPPGTNSFGCKTWDELRGLVDLIAKIHNEKLKK